MNIEKNDLISRKALLEVFSADIRYACYDVDLYDLIMAEIEDAPAVEVEVEAAPAQHGLWVWQTNGEINCSKRGGLIGVAFADTAYREAIRDHHFCLYCGTKMDSKIN